jgi:hypothetical protein
LFVFLTALPIDPSFTQIHTDITHRVGPSKDDVAFFDVYTIELALDMAERLFSCRGIITKENCLLLAGCLLSVARKYCQDTLESIPRKVFHASFEHFKYGSALLPANMNHFCSLAYKHESFLLSCLQT